MPCCDAKNPAVGKIARVGIGLKSMETRLYLLEE